MQAFKQAAELNPANEDYRVDYAALLVSGADPKLAVAAFADAARDFPRSARVHVGLGSAYYLVGQYEQAASALLHAFELDPAMPLLSQLLVRVHEAASEHRERIERATRDYIRRQPRDAEAYAAYASMLIASNRSDDKADKSQAKQYLEKAIALNPRLADAHLQLGILAQNDGDLDGAIASLTRAVEFEPDSASAHYRLGLALAKAGQSDRSKAEMQLFRDLRAKERNRDKELFSRSLTGGSRR
jgi:tetratricopeptide (TPR) repeat protein